MRGRKVKIVSDGTVGGTNLIDVATGEPIFGVESIRFVAHAKGSDPVVDITFMNIPIDVIVSVEGEVFNG